MPVVLDTERQEFHNVLARAIPRGLALAPSGRHDRHLLHRVSVRLRAHTPSVSTTVLDGCRQGVFRRLLLLPLFVLVLFEQTVLGPHVRLEKGREERVHLLFVEEVEE